MSVINKIKLGLIVVLSMLVGILVKANIDAMYETRAVNEQKAAQLRQQELEYLKELQDAAEHPERYDISVTPYNKYTKETYIPQGDEGNVGDTATLDPHSSLQFYQAPLRERKIIEVRADNYGTADSHIPMWLHLKAGKTSISADMARRTIRAVVLRMPNLKSTPELYALLLETMVVESQLGRHIDCNYGIAQFTLATAKETMSWLKSVRPDVYRAVRDLYKSDLSMKDNLTYNVPFSIALMAQYYWRVAPDLQANISTLEDRAVLWKSSYNTPLGLGTVQAYLDRARNFYKRENVKMVAVNN